MKAGTREGPRAILSTSGEFEFFDNCISTDLDDFVTSMMPTVGEPGPGGPGRHLVPAFLAYIFMDNLAAAC